MVLWRCVAILFVGVVNCQQYGPPGHTPGLPIGDGHDMVMAQGYDMPSVSGGGGFQYSGREQRQNFGAMLLGNGQVYGAPQGYEGPSQNYGVPSQQQGSNNNGQAPSQNYGVPSQEPGQNYGVPSQQQGGSGGGQLPSQNYGAPAGGSVEQNYGAPSSSYGPPSGGSQPSESYGPPSNNNQGGGVGDSSRFRIVPASEFQIPQQHSNLIRYIVLKEFQISPNGSAKPLNMGIGRNNGSPELEITKMQLPSSEEIAAGIGGSQQGGYDGDSSSGGYEGGGAGGYDGPGGYGDSDDYGDDDYDDDDANVNNNSVEGDNVVVPAVENKPPSSSPPSSMQTFMFSDPNSNSIEAQNRQGNRINRFRNRVRNRIPGRRNRNRNRNRNRSRNNNNNNLPPASSSASSDSSMPTAEKSKCAPAIQHLCDASPAMATSSSSDTPVPIDELQMALKTLSNYFNSQAQQMRAQQASASAGAASESSSSDSGSSSDTEVPSSVISAPGGDDASSSSGATTPLTLIVSDDDSGGGGSSGGGYSSSGGYQASGQPENRPGKGNFNLANVITRPIQFAAGFKSGVINTVASGLTAGIKGISAATGSISGLVSSLGAGAGGGGGVDVSSAYGVPKPVSPLRQIVGLKGQAVKTVANTGRAAVGIVGTKGKFVVNQVGTVAGTLTKGVSDTLTNKANAFNSVISHIQKIFNANNAAGGAYGVPGTGYGVPN